MTEGVATTHIESSVDDWIQVPERDIEKRNKAISKAVKDNLGYGSRIDSKVKVKVICFYGKHHFIHSAKIMKDHWLVFKPKGQKKKKKLIVISNEPSVFSMRVIFKMRTFLVWYCNFDSVATHEPDKAAYNFTTVRNVVGYINAITESDIPKVLAEKIKSGKMLREYIPWLLFFLSNLGWMYYTVELMKAVNPTGP